MIRAMKNCEEKKGRTRETVWGDEVQAVVAVLHERIRIDLLENVRFDRSLSGGGSRDHAFILKEYFLCGKQASMTG